MCDLGHPVAVRRHLVMAGDYYSCGDDCLVRCTSSESVGASALGVLENPQHPGPLSESNDAKPLVARDNSGSIRDERLRHCLTELRFRWPRAPAWISEFFR